MSERVDALEQRRQVAVRRVGIAPLRPVHDQAVDHADELLELRRAERELSAPAQEGGEIGDEQRLHHAPRSGRPAAA